MLLFIKCLSMLSFLRFSTMTSSSEDEGVATVEGVPKVAKAEWKRGSRMTPQKRASQFPGIMEVRGDSMWCGICHMGVNLLN